MHRFYAAAEKLGVDASKIKQEREHIEASGGSYSPLRLMHTLLSPTKFQQFCEHFVHDGQPVLYPDSQPFLARLQKLGIPSFIVTFGEQEWQELKIAASGLRLPYFVMDRPEKGDYLAAFQEDGAFAIPNSADKKLGYRAESLILIDDKLVAFQGLPTHCSGYLLHRPGLRRAKPTILPADVKLVHSFDQLIPG